MSLWTKLPVDVFASVDSAGNNRQPDLGETTTLITEITRVIDAATTGGGLIIYTTKAALDADLAHDANTGALVIGDSTSNDGIYVKSGASGAGSWTRVGDLPGYSFVKATDDGGSANAIAATTTLPVNETQLIVLPIATTNTGSPVTVAFNGSSALTIKTSLGNDVQSGALVAGSEMAGYVSGSTFQLITNPTTDTITDAATVQGVEPGLTGLAVLATETESAARDAVGLGAGDSPTFAGLTLNGEVVGDIRSSAEIRPGSYTTATLPAASGREGAIAYDSTLDRLTYSDNSAWNPLAKLSEVVTRVMPNASQIKFKNSSGVATKAIEVNNLDQFVAKPVGGDAKLKLQDGNGADRLTVDNTRIEASAPIKLASYTVATVPAAGTAGAGAQIYVSDEIGGAVPAFSDGTNWRRVTDRAVIATGGGGGGGGGQQ